MAVAEFWPRGRVPENYGEPVRADVPVLLLSGTHDPVTPPRWGAEAARHLPRALHVVVPGAHGVGGSGVDRVVSLVNLMQMIDREMNPERPPDEPRKWTRELLAQYLLLFESSGGDDLDRLLDFERRTMRLAARA